MSRTALKVKQRRKKDLYMKAIASGKKPHHPTKVYNRCRLCGRVGGYINRFDLCRICFRDNANKGLIMGVNKSSW